MTDLAIIETNNNAVVVNGSPVDLAIVAWLDAKSKHSGSAKTSKAYRDTLTDFRTRLGHESLATTGRYLASLSRADNPYADDLAELFGI